MTYMYFYTQSFLYRLAGLGGKLGGRELAPSLPWNKSVHWDTRRLLL